MGVQAAIAGAGLALGAVGTYMQYKGSKQAAKASERIEGLRKKQMELEGARQRRQAIREAQAARATAVTNATNQGAGESSALAGGIAQTTGQQNQNILAINQSQTIGGKIFDENAAIARAQGTSALGGAFSGFGDKLLQNAPQITRVGRYFTGNQGY